MRRGLIASFAAVTAAGVYAASAAAAVTALHIKPAALPMAQIGVPYDVTLQGAGGTAPYSFTYDFQSQPGGMGYQPNGEIVGTPEGVGSFPLTATVTDSSSPTPQTASRSYTLRVSAQGSWTLCGYSDVQNGGGNGNDNVTLRAHSAMSDTDGATGTWATKSASGRITMNFNFRQYIGYWNSASNEFFGTYTGPDNGHFAMVPGSDNGQNCTNLAQP